MYENFIFDDISSDEYGVMCVNFEPLTLQSISSQETNLKTDQAGDSDKYHIISQRYSAPLSFSLQLVNRDFSPFTSESERVIKKWLCQRGKFKLFTILDKRFADLWFFANFSNPKLKVFGDVIGLEFLVTTNAPYGFSELYEDNYVFTAGNALSLRYVDSDEDMPIYPDLEINMKASGNLTITNQVNPRNVLTINNLSSGEIITIHGSYPDISSSISSHNILTDSNRKWIYLINGYNTLQTNKACNITVVYREVRRVGIL